MKTGSWVVAHLDDKGRPTLGNWPWTFRSEIAARNEARRSLRERPDLTYVVCVLDTVAVIVAEEPTSAKETTR